MSKRAFLLSICALLAFALHARAATYYLQANMSSGSQTWDNTALWFDQPTGGSPIATSFAGQDFVQQGFQIRTGTGNYTFGNASTTLSLSGNLIARAGPTNASTMPGTITSQGGSTVIGAGTSGARLLTNNFNNAGTTILSTEISDRVLTFSVTNLTGNGNFALRHGSAGANTDGSVQLTLTDATAYTGDIGWLNSSPVVLKFMNGLTSGGGLVVPSTGRIDLTQNLTFAHVTINGTPLSAGTHSFTELDSAYGDIFIGAGGGSITVVPEPASLGLIGLVLAAVRRVRH